MNAEGKKSVLQSIFNRSGKEGCYTKFFDNLATNDMMLLNDKVSFSKDELPVVVYFRNPYYWLLITTHRVIWQNEDEKLEIEAEDLSQVNVCLNNENERYPRSKRNLELLKVITHSGDEHLIRLEPGHTFIAMWNVLKHLAIMDKEK